MAHTFSLADVSIDGDNRLTHNRDEAIREICSWDVTQQLYNYRDTYGLSTEGYTKSDGWDSPDTKLKGHGSGHYMSAIAQAYAVATNPEQKAILRKNITRMVNELRECQEKTFVYNKELKRNWEARDFAPEAELIEMKGTWTAFDEYKKHPELYGSPMVLDKLVADYNDEITCICFMGGDMTDALKKISLIGRL